MAQQKQILMGKGIQAVVSCLREPEFPTGAFFTELEYYRVDVEDMGCEPIELFWPEAAAFIHSFVSKGQPVLVHCRAGVSRSASMVMAYLVLHRGYTLCEAFARVRARRPIVSPNLGFMAKLCALEEATRGAETTVSLPKYSDWYLGEHCATKAPPDIRNGCVVTESTSTPAAAGERSVAASEPLDGLDARDRLLGLGGVRGLRAHSADDGGKPGRLGYTSSRSRSARGRCGCSGGGALHLSVLRPVQWASIRTWTPTTATGPATKVPRDADAASGNDLDGERR